MYISSYICMYTFVYSNIHTHICIYRCVYTCMYVHIYICMHFDDEDLPIVCFARLFPWLPCTYTYIYTHAHTHTNTHSTKLIQGNLTSATWIQTHIDTHAHTRTHTHVPTHIHRSPCMQLRCELRQWDDYCDGEKWMEVVNFLAKQNLVRDNSWLTISTL